MAEAFAKAQGEARNAFGDDTVFLEKAIENHFVKEEFRPMMMIDNSAQPLLDRFERYRAPVVKKWIGPEET